MELLAADGATVVTVDPHVAAFEDHHGRSYQTVPLSDDLLDRADCAVIITDHKAFDYRALLEEADLIVDTRNAIKESDPKVFKLGAPHAQATPESRKIATIA